MIRLFIFLAVVLLLFLPFNILAYRQLVRIHPARRRWIRAAILLGNLMWLFFPLMRTFAPFSRVTRAVFGPLWFGWTSFTLQYSLMLMVVLVAWIPFARRMEFARFARWPSRVFIVTIFIGFWIGFYQALVPLRIERVPIDIEGLERPARIVLMGDLHVGLFTRRARLEKIFTTAGALEPHVAMIAGDLIDDDPYFVPKLLEGAKHLPQHIPLIAVLGNHEIYGNPQSVVDQMRGSRIRLLVNETYDLHGMQIAGIGEVSAPAPFGPDFDVANRATILLSHQPKAFDAAIQRNIPLTLSAHTHGGQCGIRPLGISLAGVFLKRHMGLYREALSQLYINTGTGYWLFPFRLGMTPEITLIELRPAATTRPRTTPRS